MKELFRKKILECTGSKDLVKKNLIQNLWSGYGQILRIHLQGGNMESIVVKNVRLLDQSKHPRGWNTDISHQRKLKSYQVEMEWYRRYAPLCDNSCRIPQCYALESEGEEVLMVLEDLDQSGYKGRRTSVKWQEMEACLSWLAHFHALFLGTKPTGLWAKGTYWHLETRPDELAALTDRALRESAVSIDQLLEESPYQTLVHGDAKLANFCFAAQGREVAAVDFQYVGGGCGMKDVAYFIGSCLYEEDCERYEDDLLNYYFNKLEQACNYYGKEVPFSALKENWKELYPVAWTDFHRFMKGWSPGHWKIHSYSERLAREVVARLNKRKKQ